MSGKRKRRTARLRSPSAAVGKSILDKMEAFFQKVGLRYKLTVSVGLNLVLAAWAILSLILILLQGNGERGIAPVISPISVYAGSADQLDRAILAYFEIPKFKEVTIRYGGTLTFPKSCALTPKMLGETPYLVLKVEGEIGERLYDLTKVPSVPFTIHMNNGDVRRLVTVERIKTEGIQIRILTAVK